MHEITEETISRLKVAASRQCWRDQDEFNPMEFSGGNFDDAYSGGFEDGEAKMAREVLKAIGVVYE